MLKWNFDGKVICWGILAGQVDAEVVKLTCRNLIAKLLVDSALEGHQSWCEVESDDLCLSVLSKDVPDLAHVVQARLYQ